MSSPQQPWRSGQDRPAGPPPGYGTPPNPALVNGYQAPPGYGGQPAYGTPQGQGAAQSYGAPQGYGQQGQPQAYGSGPSGELVLNLRKPFGAMGMISPVVTIDGYPAPCQWGRNSFRAPAGVRSVDVAQTYLWTYGRASTAVTVPPGGTAELFYAGPMATFGFGGAMGTEPQRRPGTGLFVGLLVFVFALLLLVFVAVVVGSS